MKKIDILQKYFIFNNRNMKNSLNTNMEVKMNTFSKLILTIALLSTLSINAMQTRSEKKRKRTDFAELIERYTRQRVSNPNPAPRIDVVPLFRLALAATQINRALETVEIKVSESTQISTLMENIAILITQNDQEIHDLKKQMQEIDKKLSNITTLIGNSTTNLPESSLPQSVEILPQEQEKNNEKDQDGNTALHKAAYKNNATAIKQLIKDGANPNTPGIMLFTPLHIATLKENIEIMKILIAAGADVNARASNGATALFPASTPEIMNLLLENGADINIQDYTGQTPLNNAADIRDYDKVKYLLEKGANPLIKDNNGHTPLDNAAIDDEDIKKLLKRSHEK
jgi:ankyrin repeat protein